MDQTKPQATTPAAGPDPTEIRPFVIRNIVLAARAAQKILARTLEDTGVFYAMSEIDQLVYTRVEDNLADALGDFAAPGRPPRPAEDPDDEHPYSAGAIGQE